MIAAIAERAVAARDAATRLSTRLKTAVEADSDDVGADGEQRNKRLDEDADAVVHVGERGASER